MGVKARYPRSVVEPKGGVMPRITPFSAPVARKLVQLAIASLIPLACSSGDGESIGEQESALTSTIGMDADSYVRSGAPSTNYGTATTILADAADAGSTLQAYVRFTIGNVGPISNAKLRLHVANTTKGTYDVLRVAS